MAAAHRSLPADDSDDDDVHRSLPARSLPADDSESDDDDVPLSVRAGALARDRVAVAVL